MKTDSELLTGVIGCFTSQFARGEDRATLSLALQTGQKTIIANTIDEIKSRQEYREAKRSNLIGPWVLRNNHAHAVGT